MNIKIINQKLGVDSLSAEINAALSTGSYESLRILVAYISWGGINLIHDELEAFYDSGKKISLIIGVGGDYSETDALRYLKERLPKASIFIFHTPTFGYIFHPKVYIFSGKKESLIFVGSNNFTTGGLFSNSECCVKLQINHTIDHREFSSVNQLWESYAKPQFPFFDRNLRRLTDALLIIYSKEAKKIPKKVIRSFDPMKSIFPYIKKPFVSKSTSFIRPSSKLIKLTASRIKNRHRDLFLEVLDETGAKGTQVQIPREVIENYFNVPSIGQQTIEIQIGKNLARPAVICHFANNTHRISFPEISGLRRPFLMKFVRKDTKSYLVLFLMGKQYRDAIKKCSYQTRRMAKHWGWV